MAVQAVGRGSKVTGSKSLEGKEGLSNKAVVLC